MKKWIGPFISIVLILAGIFLSGHFQLNRATVPLNQERVTYQIRPIPDTEKEAKEDESDHHLGQLLKTVQQKLDSWLKSTNERIENEDVTRVEVRFLEIWRSILQWTKEKVDAKIKSSGQTEEIKEKQRDFSRNRIRIEILQLSH